ncbi:MAG: helix-turn-helix domain-containing protein [Pseudomonadota bacterium]
MKQQGLIPELNPQQTRLLAHLQAGHSLTRIDAWARLGILEAPARVCELRSMGYPIKTERVTVRNRYDEPVQIARWSLPAAQPEQPL